MNYNEIIAGLTKWEHLGVKHYPNGDVVYGEPSNSKGWGWLHQVMDSIDTNLIANFENDNPFVQNYKHIEALYQCNGVNLFSKGLFLYGLHLGGPLETAAFPLDIVTHNIELTHVASKYDGLFVGGADFDYLSVNYLETRKGEILAIDAGSEEVIHQWTNFDVFFSSEFKRLNEIFDENGHPPKDYEKRMYS